MANGVGIRIDEFVVQESVDALQRLDALVQFIVFVRMITHQRLVPA